MTDMVDRVARAINDHLHTEIIEKGHTIEGLMARGLSLELARVAIAAMREPSEGMLRALDEDGDRVWEAGGEHYFRNEDEAFWCGRLAWRAMIDAALEETGHG